MKKILENCCGKWGVKSTVVATLSLLVSFTAYAQPANDDCANAITLTCGQTVSGTTTASTDDGVSTCGTDYDGGQGVWYHFTGNGDFITLTTCDQADFDTKISVFSGSCGSLTCVDGNDDDEACIGNTSTIGFNSSNGTDYYILVHGFLGSTGNFDLTLLCTTPPSNDDCANAIALSCGDVASGYTLGATADLSLTFCSDDLSAAPGVWYSFVGDGNGVSFSLCSINTDFDTKIGVFSGSCGSLVCEDSNDDFCDLASQVDLCSTVNGQTYYIYVTGFDATEVGNFDLFVGCTEGNDDCANAKALPTTYLELFNTSCATLDGPDEPSNCTNFGFSQIDNDIWYSISPASDCDVTVSLCGSAFDTKLAVYDATGGCPSTESSLICNDDFCSLQSELTFTPTAGTTYLLRVGGFDSEAGLGILSVSVDDNAAPVIVNCPTDINQTADAGMCGAALTIPEPAFGTDFTDDCFATIENDYNNTSDASDTYPVGVTVVTWTATDVVGNTATCTQTITITDDENPSINCITSIPGCDTTASSDVGQAIDNAGLPFAGTTTVTSTLTIPYTGSINDVNVLGLDISHSWVGDLDIELISPNGTTVSLINDACDFQSSSGMLIGFDDAGLTNGTYPCDPDDGLLYQPDGSLAAFNGENAQGVWTLRITDDFTGLDFGTLNGWSLALCIGGDNKIIANADAGNCDVVVAVPTPAFSDNCAGATVVNDYNNTSDASDTYPVGTTVVTWTVTDTSGNTNTCQMEIVVTDIELPSITCPGDITIDNDPSMCDAVVTYPDPTATDNCPLPLFEQFEFNTPTDIPDGNPSGISIPISVTGISGTAMGTDVFLGSVCLDISHTWVGDLIISLESPDGTVVELVNRAGFPDLLFGCGGDNIQACFEPGTGNPAESVCDDLPAIGGTYTGVTDLVALEDGSDPNGTWTLFISDNESLDTGDVNNITLKFLTPSGSPDIVQVSGLPSGSAFPIGTTTNTFMIADASGNTSTCSFDVVVNDVEDPIMSCDVNTGVQLHDNGPLVNSPGTGPDGADVSLLEAVTTGMTLLGSGHQVSFDFRVADDFTITNPNGWTIDEIVFYAYQTGSSTSSTITQVNLRIWDGVPGVGSVVYGDGSTNLLATTEWSGIYRVDESLPEANRPIMKNTVDLGGVYLPPGTYWLDWQADGTLSSGPWAPPIAILGQTSTGNAMQSTDGGSSYAAILDGGTGDPQGLPFQILGTTQLVFYNGTGTCDAVTQLPVPLSDDCSGIVSLINDFNGTSDASGTYPAGTTTVTWTATDGVGNTSTCSYDVIVNDTVAPVITCPVSSVNCNTMPSSDVGQPIDNAGLPFAGSTTVTSTIDIGSHGIVSDVNVLGLDINHSWTGDLDIQLVSPTGTIVDLVQDPCEQATSQLLIGFDDSGLSHGTWPCDANDGLAYQPLSPLAALNGEDMYGTWELRITDDFTGLDFGTLNAWSLEICTGGDNIWVAENDLGDCSAFVTLPAATGVDNCPGLIMSNSFNGNSDASDVYPVGTTIVEWYATDSAGNADTCEVIVMVFDTEDPVITCPNDTVLNNDEGVCGAVVDYNLPPYTDNCPFPTTATVSYSGSPVSIPDDDSNGETITQGASGLPSTLGTDVFLESVCLDIDHTWVGDLIVTIMSPNGTTVTLIDRPGFPSGLFGCDGDNVDACFLPGTGADVENICSNLPALGGNFTAMTDLGAINDGSDPNGTWSVVVSDNAGGDLGTFNNFELTFSTPGSVPPSAQIAGLAPGSTFPVGTTTNTFVATDQYGNTDTCSFTVTVNDNEAPTWACIPDTIVDQEIGGVCFATVDWVPPVADDNCGVDTVFSTHEPGDLFPVGVTTVTYTAVDTTGNSSTCSFNVTVLDVEDPLLTGCPTDITASSDANSCGKSVSWTQPTASDNCSGVTLTGTHVPGDVFPIGTTTVTYTATDSSGNSVSCSFDVTVIDDVPPAISCPDDIEVCSDNSSGAVVTFATPVGSDNCMVDTVLMTTGLESGSVFPVGTTTVTFEVTDTSGNASTCSFDVIVNPTPEFDVDVVDVDCNGNGNGSITITTTFGTSPFSYSLNGGTPQSSNVFSNLDGGLYLVTVEGADGCLASTTVTVGEPEALEVDIDFAIVSCFGESTGSIVVTATGGTTPYEYSNDGGSTYQSGNAFSDLPAGVYNVRVKDANGCLVDIAVEITQPASAVSATANAQDVACFGGSSGSVTVNASGGTGAYQYSIDNGANYQGSNTFSGLAAGSYDIMVIDANGCTAMTSATVGEPASALAIDGVNATPTNCYGDSTGVIAVAAIGGTPSYTYSIDGVNFQTGATFTGLPAGAYIVTVQDDNGCTVIDTVDLTQPAPLTLDVTSTTEPDCEGDTDGSISVAGTGGTSPYEYSINGGSFQSSGTFDNLTSGTYTVTVSDEKGCTYQEVVQLEAVEKLPDASFTVVTAGGSVSFNNTSANADNYSWNFDDGGTSGDESPVHVYAESGVYNVVLIASNDCGSDTATMTLILDVTGIDEVDGASLNIYPNPTPGNFTIEYQATDNIGDFEVRVVTIDGKLVFQESKQIAGQSYTKRFDRGEFSNGVYVIEVITGENVHHQRLIIEK